MRQKIKRNYIIHHIKILSEFSKDILVASFAFFFIINHCKTKQLYYTYIHQL